MGHLKEFVTLILPKILFTITYVTYLSDKKAKQQKNIPNYSSSDWHGLQIIQQRQENVKRSKVENFLISTSWWWNYDKTFFSLVCLWTSWVGKGKNMFEIIWHFSEKFSFFSTFECKQSILLALWSLPIGLTCGFKKNKINKSQVWKQPDIIKESCSEEI